MNGEVDAADLELVRAAVNGDAQAFRELWEGAERSAYGLCLRLTGSHADAADALADTQLVAWQRLERFEARCPFAMWVYAIARNAALAVVRARTRRAEVDLAPLGDDVRFAVVATADSVADSLAVRDALATLNERHREALLLWVGGLTYAQVGVVMGAPTSSVRMWIYRARTALRAQLDASSAH